MTLQEIDARLRELSGELESAMDNGDEPAAKRITEEMDALSVRWAKAYVEGADLS